MNTLDTVKYVRKNESDIQSIRERLDEVNSDSSQGPAVDPTIYATVERVAELEGTVMEQGVSINQLTTTVESIQNSQITNETTRNEAFDFAQEEREAKFTAELEKYAEQV